ncbi:MAG TPA: signal peptidase I [Candidatus Limnocylindria bacterium]|nr:signal peptidase I [Candidatus Limnocylindria bacterium]
MTKTIGNILSLAAFAALFVLCLAFVGIRVLGLGTYIVTGGSMEPSIHKGSLVLVQPVSPSEIKVGDVITFQQYGQTTTHRVTSIGRSSAGLTFTTKGDANLVADPEDKWFPGEVGIVRGSVPVAGYVAFGVQAYWRLALTLIAAITFFACAGALVLRKETAAKAPQPIALRRVERTPVLVAADADEAWNAHMSWLRTTHRRTQVA